MCWTLAHNSTTTTCSSSSSSSSSRVRSNGCLQTASVKVLTAEWAAAGLVVRVVTVLLHHNQLL